MSRPREAFDFRGAAMRMITSWLLAVGTTCSLSHALFPAQALWPAVLWCGGLCLGLGALFELPFRRKFLLSLAILAGLVIWALLGGGPGYTAAQLTKALFLSLRGVTDAALPYAQTARVALCVIFCVAAIAVVWDDSFPLACFLVITLCCVSFLIAGGREQLLCALPGFAGLIMMLSGQEGRRPTLLPVALLLAALAFCILPGEGQTVPALKEAARQVRQFVEDYLFFNDYRTSFSLAAEGYQPQRERLGGPAAPDGHTVMEVETDRMVLLRGRTYNEYSGINWYDTLSARRYLYQSPRYAAVRDDLFDQSRPLAGAGEIPEETLRIHLLSDGVTTLFAPQRFRTLQLEGDRMVLYFNLAGELFLTRDTAAGDQYTLSYLPLTPENAATEAAIAACADLDDPNYAAVCQDYLALPSHIQQEIYDLARQITANAQTPYEKALALEKYLRQHYRYRLDVDAPPENVDFVAWFLIGTQEGYCTYFASAMTVLCRIAGIPARYVTGYLAVPDEEGRAVVTGRDAHAWTEIYLNGFGWLAMDATPRGDNDRTGDDPGDSRQPQQTVPPAVSPTPTPTPTPSPTPTPDPGQAPSPSPDSEEQPEQAPTPTPPPGGSAPSPSSQPNPQPTSPPLDGDEEGPRFPWWVLLILLAVIALLIFRFLQTEPIRHAARKPDRAAALYFAAISALLAGRKLRRAPAETLAQFAQRVEQALEPALAPLACDAISQYAAQVYGNHPADTEALSRAYRALRQDAPLPRRALLALRRMLGLKTPI